MTREERAVQLGLNGPLHEVSCDQAAFLRQQARDWRVQSLAELWWMRQRFYADIRRGNGGSLSGTCGSFLGFMWRQQKFPHVDRDNPAVVVVHTREDAMPTIGGPAGLLYAPVTPFDRPLWCAVDRICARRDQGHSRTHPTPLSPANETWRRELLEHPEVVRPGAAIHGSGAGSVGHVFRSGEQWYFTTAGHVADYVGTDVRLESQTGPVLGPVIDSKDSESLNEYLEGTLARLCTDPPPPGGWPSNHRFFKDAALVRLEASLPVDPSLGPWLDRTIPGPIRRLQVDAKGFDPLGVEVVSVGQTRGLQFGRIIGFSIEILDAGKDESDPNLADCFCDYLILPIPAPGEQVESGFRSVFSGNNDSGKGLWTWPDLEPIAILRGTGNGGLSLNAGVTFWSTANDLSRVIQSTGSPPFPPRS